MDRPILFIENGLTISQLVMERLSANGYSCRHILASSQPQVVTDRLSVLDTDGRHADIELGDYPVAILDRDFGDSAPGQELVSALTIAGITCFSFRFRRGKLDLDAFDSFLREELPTIYTLPRSQGSLVGKVIKRILHFFWRGFEWLIN